MHSIERYGIVALLFLVVTVVAVLMWDGGKGKKKDLAGQAVAPVAGRERPGAEERRAARRLSLAAEPQPGPLVRQPQRRTGEPEPGAETPPASAPGDFTAPLEPEAAEARPPAVAPQTITPREEPAREPVVGRAPAPSTHAYTVRPGDTLSEISQRELGSARRWQEIVAANPGLDPARVRAGQAIRIPGTGKPSTAPAPAPTQAAPARAARTWRVGKGENLWKIAERALGDGKRWPEIAALNPRVKPDRLMLGLVLTLPDAAPAKEAPAAKKGAAEHPTLVASTGGGRFQQRGGKVR